MPLKISNKKRDYHTIGKTIYSCQYHIIWCTKYRRKVLDTQIQGRLKHLIRDKQEEYIYEILEIETQSDHIHILIDIPTSISIDKIVGKIKGYTSKVLREEYPSLKTRLPSLWTRSKFVSSCGDVTLKAIKDYIENQSGQ